MYLFLYFYFILIFACSLHNNHQMFWIVAENRSRLAAIYVGDDVAANWRLQTLLLL